MRIREKIFALIPDTDDLPDDAAVQAQNALIALSYLYDFVLDPNPVTHCTAAISSQRAWIFCATRRVRRRQMPH